MAEEDKKEDRPKDDQPVAGNKDKKKEEIATKPEAEKVEEVNSEIEEKPKEAPEAASQLEPAAKEKNAEPKPEPAGKFKDLIKEIETLSVVDLAELVKALEDRFGVSAAMPVAAAPGIAAAGGGGEAKEEKANYTVMLAAAGDQKINVIKAVREIRQDLGLKEAKDLVDGAPKELAKDMPKEEAETAKKKLEAVGATIELK